jgi:excisionase family DNA binding protein
MAVLTAAQAAAFLQIHVETFYLLAKAGKIPAARVGRNWICLKEDLIQYMRTSSSMKTDVSGDARAASSPLPRSVLRSTLRVRYERALAPAKKTRF